MRDRATVGLEAAELGDWAADLLVGAVVVHDSACRWRILQDQVANYGTTAEIAGAMGRVL